MAAKSSSYFKHCLTIPEKTFIDFYSLDFETLATRLIFTLILFGFIFILIISARKDKVRSTQKRG